MELEAVLLERVETWERLSRWEKSELGKDLRRAGLSYGEIMGLIPVKKSTLATWCRDVKLTEEQLAAIRVRNPALPGIPRNTQRKRHREIELITAQAALEAIHLQDDPFWTIDDRPTSPTWPNPRNALYSLTIRRVLSPVVSGPQRSSRGLSADSARTRRAAR